MSAGLAGAGVLITRPAGQCEHLAGLVREHGGTAVVFPAMDIEPTAAANRWPTRLPPPADFDLFIFISRNAVRFGARHLPADSASRVAAVGPSTARSLTEQGIAIGVVPELGFTSEALLAHPRLTRVAGQRILIVRGQGGRELLASVLRERGATVHYLEVYRRSLAGQDAAATERARDALAGRTIRFVTATSVQTLENLRRLLGAGADALLQGAQLVTASDRVVKMASQHGIPAAQAAGPSDEDLLALMLELSTAPAGKSS